MPCQSRGHHWWRTALDRGRGQRNPKHVILRIACPLCNCLQACPVCRWMLLNCWRVRPVVWLMLHHRSRVHPSRGTPMTCALTRPLPSNPLVCVALRPPAAPSPLLVPTPPPSCASCAQPSPRGARMRRRCGVCALRTGDVLQQHSTPPLFRHAEYTPPSFLLWLGPTPSVRTLCPRIVAANKAPAATHCCVCRGG